MRRFFSIFVLLLFVLNFGGVLQAATFEGFSAAAFETLQSDEPTATQKPMTLSRRCCMGDDALMGSAGAAPCSSSDCAYTKAENHIEFHNTAHIPIGLQSNLPPSSPKSRQLRPPIS
ncbi:MAG: hypothetical protein COA52_06575 [Hyphomicrobiales bacterium]|nr:MAG: hypothetical protein COA52_06575 [Hyphomicrobiales bacterium]